jgi:hypothetical protein
LTVRVRASARALPAFAATGAELAAEAAEVGELVVDVAAVLAWSVPLGLAGELEVAVGPQADRVARASSGTVRIRRRMSSCAGRAAADSGAGPNLGIGRRCR